MTLKLTAGLLILFVAFALQGWLASEGWRLDLVFPALITFAFLFSFWEMLLLTLLGVFILNWQPAASVEILIFAIVPVAVYFSKHILPWQPWAENLFMIALGTLLLYAIVAGSAFMHYLGALTDDLAAGLIFGTLIFASLWRWEKHS